jgi:hypothetical protein
MKNTQVTRTVLLPKVPGDESGVVEVGLNGRFYLLTRGESLELPLPLIDVLRHGGLIG